MSKFFIIAICLITSVAYSQDEEIYDHGLDEEKWEDIREGIRYEGQEGAGREWTYESQEEYERERKKYESGEGNGGNGTGGQGDGSGDRYDGASERENRHYKPPPPRSSSSLDMPNFSGLGFIGWILLIAFGVGLIILLFYLFVNGEKKGAKIKPTSIDFDEVNPVEIPLTELERLLQEAIANKDYRGAIRIYFIFIVRDLAQKNWINWEKEKTNFHYLHEMSGKNEFDDFNISVSYFEIIWYGKREIDSDKFEKVRPKFTNFLDKLGVK